VFSHFQFVLPLVLVSVVSMAMFASTSSRLTDNV
jgi:hypothetical protein